jgi:hypothetical protein
MSPPPGLPSPKSRQSEHHRDTVNTKPRQQPAGGAFSTTHTAISSDAYVLTPNVAQQSWDPLPHRAAWSLVIHRPRGSTTVIGRASPVGTYGRSQLAGGAGRTSTVGVGLDLGLVNGALTFLTLDGIVAAGNPRSNMDS